MASTNKRLLVTITIVALVTFIMTSLFKQRYINIRLLIQNQYKSALPAVQWSYTEQSPEFTKYIEDVPVELDDNGMDLAFEVINNQSILPPSARIRARKIFKEKPLVIWATEWHMTPIKDIADLLTPFGVTVKNYNLDPFRCAWQDCNAKKNLKVLTPNNVLDAVPEVVNKYIEEYSNNTEMESVDLVYCGYPGSLCEIYGELNKSVLVLATTRYDVGRYTVARLNLMNERFRNLSRSPWIIFGGNNLYDARFIQYYTGIPTHHIPSMCDYTGSEYTSPAKSVRTFLLLRRRDRGFNKLFFDDYKAACNVINCTAELQGLGGYSYADIGKHRGVVHVPYQISVMSIFEQYRMNIPMFFPSPDLLASWQVKYYIMPERSFEGAFFSGRPSKSPIGPDPSQKHVPDPKNELDFNSTRYWMEFADFYQIMPYGVIYNSIPHLVRILNEITNAELLDISSKMREYNIQFKKKLLRKWRKILLEYAKNSPNHPH